MFGRPLPSNGYVTLSLAAGDALVYGTLTDNRNQDPCMEVAESAVAGDRETKIIPVFGSTEGRNGARFRTAIALLNATDKTERGNLVFLPRGSSIRTEVAYQIAPGAIWSGSPALEALTGFGSCDVISSEGDTPLVWTRVYNDDASGTTGMLEIIPRMSEALTSGDERVLIGAASASEERMNVGIRTFLLPTTLRFEVRGAEGTIVRTSERAFAPESFDQFSINDLTGGELHDDDSVRVILVNGQSMVYGVLTDNLTNDPRFELLRH